MIQTFVEVAASVFALSLSAAALPASAASLSRSVDVEATPSAVWLMIGPFCAIKDWLPPVGSCTEDGKVPPTRTLVTKDGNATFVETQTARSDAEHFYTYMFQSSPLPVTRYTSTIRVTDRGQGISTVTWQGDYVPEYGKDKDASDALNGIYGAGLDAIRAKLAKQANDLPAASLQRTVQFGQLDLTQPAAAQQLYQKLKAAAKQVCEPVNGAQVRQKYAYRSCVTRTLANAVTEVNRPLLTSVHDAKGGRSIAALRVATK